MADELDMDYPIEDNLALAPSYSNSYRNERNDRNDLKVITPLAKKAMKLWLLNHFFGEAGQIVMNLKERKTIVLNLHLFR